MKLFLKILLVLILVLILAVIGIAITFNPNDHKKEIISEFNSQTGRTLTISGDISLSLFPWIGIDLGETEISNAKGFGKQPFAKMSHLQVRARLWPLFKQQLEADTIVIEGLTLNLAKNKHGISNWEDFTKKKKKIETKKSKSPPKTKAEKTQKKNENKKKLASFALNGINIQDAQFNWHDKQQKQKISVKNIQLNIGKLRPKTTIPISIQFHLQKTSLDAKVKFDSNILFSPESKQLSLNKINMEFNDTHINGNAKISLAKGSSSLNLTVNKINFDHYLSKTKSADTQTKSHAKTKTSKYKNKGRNNNIKSALIPVAFLSKLNMDTNFKINKIQIKNTRWTNFNFVTHAKNGYVQIKLLTMQGYAAKIQSNFNIKIVKNNALLSGNLNIDKINIGNLLNDLIGKDKLKGQTSITASFNTSGVKLSQLKKNLNGKLKFNLKNGILKGVDLNHKLKILDAKIKRKPIPTAPKPEETKIAKLTASATIKNGILNNKNLRASTLLSSIAGRGTINLVKEQLNYTATIKLATEKDVKANKSFEEISSTPLDIDITGSFDNPQIQPNFQKILNNSIKREIKKEQNKIKEKLIKDLEKKLSPDLKKLFKL